MEGWMSGTSLHLLHFGNCMYDHDSNREERRMVNESSIFLLEVTFVGETIKFY